MLPLTASGLLRAEAMRQESVLYSLAVMSLVAWQVLCFPLS